MKVFWGSASGKNFFGGKHSSLFCTRRNKNKLLGLTPDPHQSWHQHSVVKKWQKTQKKIKNFFQTIDFEKKLFRGWRRCKFIVGCSSDIDKITTFSRTCAINLFYSANFISCHGKAGQGITKGGSITVPLTSCLTRLD
jgi:hypothetical protein